MAIDYEQAKVLLNNSYEKAAQELPAAVTQYITDNKDALDTIFSSKTQSYREVLLGCAVARYQDRSCNIRHPYVKQGEDAFNGRTLDEKAVNPFLFSKVLIWRLSAGMLLSLKIQGMDCAIRKALTLCCH